MRVIYFYFPVMHDEGCLHLVWDGRQGLSARKGFPVMHNEGWLHLVWDGRQGLSARKDSNTRLSGHTAKVGFAFSGMAGNCFDNFLTL